MKLSQYLADAGVTQEAFGKSIGVKRLAVLRYLNGQRKPSPATAKRIIKVTKGQVAYEDLYK